MSFNLELLPVNFNEKIVSFHLQKLLAKKYYMLNINDLISKSILVLNNIEEYNKSHFKLISDNFLNIYENNRKLKPKYKNAIYTCIIYIMSRKQIYRDKLNIINNEYLFDLDFSLLEQNDQEIKSAIIFVKIIKCYSILSETIDRNVILSVFSLLEMLGNNYCSGGGQKPITVYYIKIYENYLKLNNKKKFNSEFEDDKINYCINYLKSKNIEIPEENLKKRKHELIKNEDICLTKYLSIESIFSNDSISTLSNESIETILVEHISTDDLLDVNFVFDETENDNLFKDILNI